MSYYLEVETTSFGMLTAKTGGEDVAKRLSNTDSTVAGADFTHVYNFDLSVEQPHNENSAGNMSAAPATHIFTVSVPDYEPLAAAALNVMNSQDVIKKAVLNITRRENTQHVVTQQTTFTNGMLTDFRHIVKDQRDPEALKHRGEIQLTFKFQKVQTEDKVANTQGNMSTIAA